MDPRKIKDSYHLCFQRLLKLASSLRDLKAFLRNSSQYFEYNFL